jgi:hypothetical protein
MSEKSEQTISEEKVREEHLAEVNATAHWLYLFGVVVASTLVMIVFIALLAGGS